MDQGTLATFAQRLEALERQNRRLRQLGALEIVGLAALVLMGQAVSGNAGKALEAERFVLRDAGGRVRMLLHTEGDGSPQLEFRDAAGIRRATLGVRGDVAHLSLADAKGTGGALLRTGADGRPSLTLADGNGTRRAVLFLSADGSPTLGFSDKERRSRLVLNALPTGAVGLSLYDAEGRFRALLDLDPDGSPALALFDKNQRSRAILGHAELEHRQGGAPEKRGAASLVLFNEAETVIWQAP